MPSDEEPASPAVPADSGGASLIAILAAVACLASALGVVLWLVLRPPGGGTGPVPPPPPVPAAPVFVSFRVEWKEDFRLNSESPPGNIRSGQVVFQDSGYAYVRASVLDLDLRSIRDNTGGSDEIPLPGSVFGGLNEYRIRFERSTGGGSAEDCTKIHDADGGAFLLRFPRGSLDLTGVPTAGALGPSFDPTPAGIAQLSKLGKAR